MISHKSPLILASGSAARRTMLENAGLAFDVMPADIDEDSIFKNMDGQGAQPEGIAAKLADEKALAISKANPQSYIIGSDQILELNGKIFQKASNENDAREKLKSLRGKAHQLISSVSVAQNNDIIWRAHDTAKLTMHDFSDEFLEDYITTAGNDLTSCVGAYAFEKHGSWLFESIDANYFTILGMPLLLLLDFLKEDYSQ